MTMGTEEYVDAFATPEDFLGWARVEIYPHLEMDDLCRAMAYECAETIGELDLQDYFEMFYEGIPPIKDRPDDLLGWANMWAGATHQELFDFQAHLEYLLKELSIL